MKLEYENKVNLITSPLPRKKATADDFNEIKRSKEEGFMD